MVAEDHRAFAAGIGFTDIIKRPRANAKSLPAIEYEFGRGQLIAKLETHRPELVIFTFKKTAQVLFGAFGGNGFVPGLRLGLGVGVGVHVGAVRLYQPDAADLRRHLASVVRTLSQPQDQRSRDLRLLPSLDQPTT